MHDQNLHDVPAYPLAQSTVYSLCMQTSAQSHNYAPISIHIWCYVLQLCRDIYEDVETMNPSTAVADDVVIKQNPAYGVLETSSKL